MPHSKLTSIFRTGAGKLIPKILSPPPPPPPPSSSVISAPSDYAAVKELVIPSLERIPSEASISSKSSSSSSATKSKKKESKPKPPSKWEPEVKLNAQLEPKPLSELFSFGLEPNKAASAHDKSKSLWKEISSVFYTEPQDAKDTSAETLLSIPWHITRYQNNTSTLKKEVSRERKAKWVYNNSHVCRFSDLYQTCAQSIGAKATVNVFGKLGRHNGVKEYNGLIDVCIKNARASIDEDAALKEVADAIGLFMSMKEAGFEIKENSYGSILMYLIDMRMEEQFHCFVNIIKENNADALRLAYYEMLLYARSDNEAKIQDLCSNVLSKDGGDVPELQGNYLQALSECDRKEMLQLLEVIDIKRISSLDCLTSIFKSFGRLQLESLAKKFLLSYKCCDEGKENISNLIFYYVANVPNLATGNVITNFASLHEDLDVTPSSAAYENLIVFCCSSQKVYAALDIADKMCNTGMTLSVGVLNTMLRVMEDCYEFNLVHKIYSMIFRHNLKPNADTFRSMISLSVKMKDFDAAYDMFNYLEEKSLHPTPGMYNAILSGHLREKNVHAAMHVLNQMRDAKVKPDSQTYYYLLCNSSTEEEINKCYAEMMSSGVQVTKTTYMGLIVAYANCGLFEKAKQVISEISEKGILDKNLNEIKGVLISALAGNKQIDDALSIYQEMKRDGYNVEQKCVITLIENLKQKGERSTLLQLLEDLDATKKQWDDGCCRIILYCVKYLHLSTAVDLLKRLGDKFNNDELAMDSIFTEVFSLIAEGGSAHLLMGLDLLRVIKEDFGLLPSRKTLDFLLAACVNSKDSNSALLVWREYAAANLPYNVLSFLWMYQVLLAGGDYKAAKILLRDIPKDDPHVRTIVKACQKTYIKTSSTKKDVKSGVL